MSGLMSWLLLSSGFAAFAALGPAPTQAQAQEAYPSRTIRLVVGFGAGGPTDIPARFIADKLGSLLGQRVIVENKAGAAGQIATRDVLAHPRDGYHLLLCTHFESINTALYKKVAFKLGDIAPITQISRYYYGLALANSLPAQTLDEFFAHAKANPSQVHYASVGGGSVQEIFARQLAKRAGITLNKVAFKDGATVMRELLAGRVHFFVSPTLSVLPHYQAGKLKILAVTSPERLAVAPDVPTLTEKGIHFVAFGWLGICAGAGTPQPILALLNRHIASIVNTPDYRALIEKAGSIPLSSTPEELGKILIETHEQVASTIQEFGMQID
ncbi:MAG: tripartite tricarboxylate transporter substrate binding protein [Rhizobiales bacterium]|nr:tripartite tricarboxylate transporter substrate binding protein [Hyphomicrobiales bacterium]